MSGTGDDEALPRTPPRGDRGGGPRRIDARCLLGSAGEAIIVHGRQEYRLRRTNSDKLILTK
ncbi:hypothetical protein KBTX_00324 [wastewater metagenome]|uniref:Hemin uptake protein HemP n=2 Tax=unclassified sequences TaxID=12908 RepID=A0A5B8R7Y1_9ZZZZ|nr:MULTISPECIES: hemin uptake protein HemP [Arhodomonas]MCS4505122.1 hemin uptake protein HemP [Arhodomonas aquaeolei]QEA04023.1 hypothetical protein KBTEX_00324 [uncultured organism]